jgi:regulator of sigma E protease
MDLHNPTWDDLAPKIMMNPDQPVEMTIQRDGQTIHTTVVPQAVGPERIGDAGLLPINPVLVDTVDPDLTAAKAGIKPGDQIVSINGTTIHNMQELIDSLQVVRNNPTAVKVLRGGQELAFTVTPELGDVDQSGEKRFRIGITRDEFKHVDKLPFGAALSRAYGECKSNSILIFELVGKMIQHKVSVRQVSGPIMIGKISGQAAMQKGWIPLLMVMAIISLNLAVFNLFPIPILDGGLMLMLLIESVMRRDIKQEVKERVYQAAFVFLVLFAAVVIFNDVAKTIPGLS